MMRRILAVLTLFALGACTSTGQRFVERTYTEPDVNGDQWVTDETIVKNRTIAPPFGSKASATHNFSAGVDAAGNWDLVMGSNGALEGGDLSAFVQALAGFTAELTRLVAEVKAMLPTPPLEPLAPP
jgi:hypothetical protein